MEQGTDMQAMGGCHEPVIRLVIRAHDSENTVHGQQGDAQAQQGPAVIKRAWDELA